MSQVKKRKRFFLSHLKPEQLRVLEDYETIVDRIREQNPEAANSLSLLKDMISDFTKFSQIMEQQSHAPSCLAATSFDTYKKACEAVGVNYNMQDLDHQWELREADSLSDGTLSPCVDICIKELWGSGYVDIQESETFCRTIMDLMFLDRLRALKDENATRYLKFVPEVSLSVERGGATITGRADWCLGHGNVRGGFESTLIILEAKKLGTAQSRLPQLIICLAAVQDARKESHKMNSAVFGLVTDSSVFQFVYLDPARKLFTSRLLQWVTDKKRIVQWIDRVLEDSIKASPHTTPVKSSNRTLRACQAELKRGHLFGDPSNDNSDLIDAENERPVNVVWRGESFTVVECDETEDTDDTNNTEE